MAVTAIRAKKISCCCFEKLKGKQNQT